MGNLIFATNNENKVTEIRSVLPGFLQILTLKEAGIFQDIPEPWSTLKENAREKSEVIHILTGKECFSEDTGLIVPALDGEPGVKSARYAGEPADNQKNIALLLKNLDGETDRAAYFHTVICLIFDNDYHYFEGKCPGQIIHEERGENGFGYDAVFIPDGSERTFAEMDMEQKNQFSHRKKATQILIEFLNTAYGKA